MSVAILITEVSIAFFVRDQFIRPFLGDFLAVILLYSIGRCLFSKKSHQIALAVLGIAYLIEFLQYLQILKKLNLAEYPILVILLGTQFDWTDILSYTLGIITIYSIDIYFIRKED